MPGPGDLLAQIKAKRKDEDAAVATKPSAGKGNPAFLSEMLKQRGGLPPQPSSAREKLATSTAAAAAAAATTKTAKTPATTTDIPDGALFVYNDSQEAFVFRFDRSEPELTSDKYGNKDTDILIPLAPCIYRSLDYTLAKREPILLKRCVLKLGVLRCLTRECKNLNSLLKHRLDPAGQAGSIEEEELGTTRFMELLSNCGVFQKVAELLLKRAGQVGSSGDNATGNEQQNPFRIPQIQVDGLDDFLCEIQRLVPSLGQARHEIETTQSVSFYPGLGELFCPGSQLLTYPEGMEGSPLGCSCVQSWYAEELNKATGKLKRRFILVVEFIVSVGDHLVFVAASDVYPEFHDPNRNIPLKDLTHRKLLPLVNPDDASILKRLQRRGEFYASVSTQNHFLEYYPNSFFPIITSAGWSNNAVRPLSKSGRVMVDVKRGILEGHMPVRGTADGMSDTVKEAIKLYEQSKRTGVAVPFRTCILPESGKPKGNKFSQERGDSDRSHLWQSWPMLTGFSFTARVWGKLLLGMPKLSSAFTLDDVGLEKEGGSCGNCGYIKFQEQAFEQLVLAEDKKELIRAVARNAGGSSRWDDEGDDDDDNDDDDDDDNIALDVVANKGAASIFLLHGPPGTGKTLTAEAIAELLRKPLYIVTAGDLGITAAEVEKTLGSVLELCQTWDALVLIDEADVFLEARKSTEIQRNALVCVMLRLLEYYSGCLFLSSNRAAESIDAAIASRITVMLGYPLLDIEGRGKVWKNLVELVPVQPTDPSTGGVLESILKNPRKLSKYRVEFTEAEYHELASGYQLNGRQIKNSIVLARALARERGMPLSLPILRRAVTAVAGEGATV